MIDEKGSATGRRRDPRVPGARLPRVVNAVALASGSYPAAEDAVQEALVRAWIRSERGERLESLPAWVAAVALNQTRSGWRRTMAERRARHRMPQRAAIQAPP